jgi:hypothetical protein
VLFNTKTVPVTVLSLVCSFFRALIEAMIFLDNSERSSSASASLLPTRLTVSGVLDAAHASIASLTSFLHELFRSCFEKSRLGPRSAGDLTLPLQRAKNPRCLLWTRDAAPRHVLPGA